MKNIIFALGFLLFVSSESFAAIGVKDAYVPYDLKTTAYTTSNTLLSAVTATGAGTKWNLQVPMNNHMCTATWGGTAPTNIIFTIDGSEDGTNFAALATVTMTESPYIFHISKPSVLYIRSTYSSKSSGDTTTSLTVTCTSGGN